MFPLSLPSPARGEGFEATSLDAKGQGRGFRYISLDGWRWENVSESPSLDGRG
jgi:hypothetical protein